MTPLSRIPSNGPAYRPPVECTTWRESLLLQISTNHIGRSPELNGLIAKFAVDTPDAIPDEDEWNSLVLQCMLHHEVEPLTAILAENPLQTLSITRPVTPDAWKTLQDALPASCSILRLVLSDQNLSEDHASLLLSIMERMLQLESLRVDACTVDFRSPLKFSSSTLRDLCVTGTKTPYFLLESIIKGSKLTKVYLSSNPGMGEDDNLELFLTLSACTTLRELALRNMSAGRIPKYAPFYRTYVNLVKKTLTHLDLSNNPLSGNDCKLLMEALKENTTLSSLSLAGCWPKANLEFQWNDLATIVGHKSLVCLDLSNNSFTSEAAPVLEAIQRHPALRQLYLAGITASDYMVIKILPKALAENTTLIFLRLPYWSDSAYEPLAKAMEKNQILRSLSIPKKETEYSTMGAHSPEHFENYLALVERISLNHRTWDEKRIALIEGGLRVVTGSQDVAHYMAPHVYETGNGDEAMNLTLLNKQAHENGLAAIDRLQKQQKKEEK